MTPPGRTNVVEAYETVEFLRDGSFKISDSIITDGKKQTQAMFSGSYKLTDANHVRLEVTPLFVPGAEKITVTALCQMDRDELELPKFITSVVPETKKYRRVKR